MWSKELVSLPEYVDTGWEKAKLQTANEGLVIVAERWASDTALP
jgi:hypothetical protein